MNNKQVAQAFALGATSGKSLNMFIDGDTVYSYGYHFKIAVRYNGVYLVNSKTYSNTTQRHISHVVNALPYHLIIKTPNCDIDKAGDYLKEEIARAKQKALKARLDHMVEHWAYVADKLEEMLELSRNIS